MLKQGGSHEFYKKIYLENNFLDIAKTILVLRKRNEISKQTSECVRFIIGFYVYSNLLNLDLKKHKKDIEELEEYFKNELMFLKSLQFDKDIDINKVYNDIKK
jgi:hypothetical protein